MCFFFVLHHYSFISQDTLMTFLLVIFFNAHERRGLEVTRSIILLLHYFGHDFFFPYQYCVCVCYHRNSISCVVSSSSHGETLQIPSKMPQNVTKSNEKARQAILSFVLGSRLFKAVTFSRSFTFSLSCVLICV